MSKKGSVIFIAIVCFVLGVVLVAAIAISAKGAAPSRFDQPASNADQMTKRICNPHYDYPGCSPEQQRSLEAGNRPDMRQNWEKRRWGQSHNEWAGLSDRMNDRLRRAYAEAVDHVTGPLVAATWSDFKEKSDCMGAFQARQAPVAAWCNLSRSINDVFEPVERFNLKCGGRVLSAAVVGAASQLPNVYAVAPGFVGGAGVGAASCVIEEMWDDVWNLNKRKQDRQLARRTYRAIDRAWQTELEPLAG